MGVLEDVAILQPRHVVVAVVVVLHRPVALAQPLVPTEDYLLFLHS